MAADDKPFDFAQHLTTQLLTLASGIPALMITFAKDFVSNVPADAKIIAFWGWGCFTLSVLCGLLTLMALTGILAAGTKLTPNQGIMTPNVRIFSGCQVVTFFAGLVLVVVFGWKAA